MKLPCAYSLGSVVYLRVDTDGLPGMISDVRFSLGGSILYLITWGNRASSIHYEAEVTPVRAFSYTDGGVTTEND